MTVPEVYKVYNSILSEFQRRGYRERLSYVRTFLRQIDFHNMIAWLLGLAEDWRVVGGAGSPDQNRQYAEMVEEIAAEINNRLPWLENGLQDTLESGNAMRPEWCPPPLYEPQEAEIEGPEWRDSLAGWEWGMWYLLSETAALSTVEEIGGPPDDKYQSVSPTKGLFDYVQLALVLQALLHGWCGLSIGSEASVRARRAGARMQVEGLTSLLDWRVVRPYWLNSSKSAEYQQTAVPAWHMIDRHYWLGIAYIEWVAGEEIWTSEDGFTVAGPAILWVEDGPEAEPINLTPYADELVEELTQTKDDMERGIPLRGGGFH